MSAETAPRPGKFADYALTQFLGEGSEGAVFAARPAPHLRVCSDVVALKIMRNPTDPAGFRTAAEELRCVRCLRSPSVVTLHEVGREPSGAMYCAMEYAEEGSLARPARSLSREDVLRAVASAAHGAHALHEAGIIHGAIRPSNVLLGAQRATLAEPDLSHLLWPGRSFHAGRPVGLVQFVDPALILGAAPSRASDIWALGVTLHAALTGKPIYYRMGPDLVPALRTALTSAPTIDWSLTPDEAELVRACLAPHPGDRPPTALEVAERIERLLGVKSSTPGVQEAAAVEAEPTTSGPAGFEAVPLWTAEPPAPRDAVARARRRTETCAQMVEGILCKRGHFNHPLASYCLSCGISLLQGSRRRVRRPRPTLGLLILDDGSICNLDTDYVIGRAPSADASVQEGRAQPLRLDDEKHRVSGVHAGIHLDGWRVLLTDLDSGGGTFIRPAGSQEWTHLEAGQPVELHSRTVVRIGEREVVFSSNRER